MSDHNTTAPSTVTAWLDEKQALVDAVTEGAAWEEAWRAIPGCEGYEVSDHGSVRSYWLRGNHAQKRTTIPRLLALRARKDGRYPGVQLPNGEGKFVTRAVHQLVLLAFIGPCPAGHEVAHLNGNAADNRLANLSYVTHVENESHKAQHGTRGLGEQNANAKLLGWQVAEIKYLGEKGVPAARIAALFDIRRHQVNDILSGRAWASVDARPDFQAATRALLAVEGLANAADFSASCDPDQECGLMHAHHLREVITTALRVQP